MYNKETVIRLNHLDDVQEFVGAASKCDFDIDLKYRQILIDAEITSWSDWNWYKQ